MRGNETQQAKRPWILIAAYDVSTGATSEGYVAFNILQRLSKNYRIILVTRRNNRDRLLASSEAMSACRGMRIIGFDLPRWASWWKRGSRFYFPYAYLWQLFWPFALVHAKRLRAKISVCHVLNFHNDSIPSLAWILGVPVVWGPLNHNELAPAWRWHFWPHRVRIKARLGFLLRRIAWRIDPWLRLSRRKATIIVSAGPWVDRRLGVENAAKIVHLSQLGIDASLFAIDRDAEKAVQDNPSHLLVHAGRLDWIKGLDIAIEALREMPPNFHLLLIGSGPAEGRLRTLVKEIGVANRVKFEPPMLRKDLAVIYSAASLFLFPSSEAAGLAWGEALASGLPVVGFDGDSVLSLASKTLPGISLTRPSLDRAANIENYAALVKDAVSWQYDREEIRKRALEKFGWNSLCKEIRHLYQSLGGNR